MSNTFYVPKNLYWEVDGTGDIGASAASRPNNVYLKGYLDINQITTPSNPASGEFRLYFKSDGNLYSLNSSGVEAQVNAASLTLPGSSTNTAIVRWSGTGGNSLLNSTVTIANTTGAMSFTATSGANITWSTDGAGDIGASGATRPNNIWIKTSANIGTIPSTSGGGVPGAGIVNAGGGDGISTPSFYAVSDQTTASFTALSAGTSPGFNGLRANGTTASPSIVTSGNTLVGYQAYGYDGTTYRRTALMQFVSDNTWTGGSSYPTRFTVSMTKSGATAITEMFRIDSAGQVILETSSGANLIWNTDGAGDIGASGATRPNNAYIKTNITVGGQVLVSAGTSSNPSIVNGANTNTGLNFLGGNQLTLTAAGTDRLFVSPTQVTVENAQFRTDDGTVSAPAHSFSSEVTSGLWRIGTSNLGISIAGTNVLNIKANGLGVSTVPSIEGDSGTYVSVVGTTGHFEAGCNTNTTQDSVIADVRFFNGSNFSGQLSCENAVASSSTSANLYLKTSNAGTLGIGIAIDNLQRVTIGKGTSGQHTLNTLSTTGASVGTLTNVPVSGNPAGYIQITINGSTHYIPYW